MSNSIFNSNTKKLALILMVVGIISVIIGFASTPSDIAEVTAILEAHHPGHEVTPEHAEHALHQMQNKPWSAVYTSTLFFTLIALGAAFFFAIQYVARAGWSVMVIRIMDAMAKFLPVGGAAVLLLLILSSLHLNHMFHWMVTGIDDPASPNYDAIIAGKTGYLNVGFFLVRAVIFIVGWVFLFGKISKLSLAQDAEGSMTNLTNYNKTITWSAAFLVFFAVSSSIMSWDWIMSIDTHWFSTLFGWYVFASFFVSALAVMNLIVLYLKSKGFLEMVNKSHVKDLAKFMFAFSIFWTYLWFSQFILIWYADIPEEVTYYMQRWEEYRGLFWGSMLINLCFPILVLMSADMKKIPWFVAATGIVVIVGHYLDFYLMITPGTVGEHWNIGFAEIGAFLLFLGAFIFVVFRALDKLPLVPTGHPLMKESKHHHS